MARKPRLDLTTPPEPDEQIFEPWQLSRSNTYLLGRLNGIIRVGIGVVVAIVVSTSIYGVVSSMQRGDISDAAEAARLQGVGAAVGSCALNQVTIVMFTDSLTRQQLAGFRAPGMTDAAADAFYDNERAILDKAIFDCKVLAPKDDQINIELQVPTTMPAP